MRWLPLVAALSWGSAACATPPVAPRAPAPATAESVTGQLLSELLMGSHGPLDAPALCRYVSGVGERVARVLPGRKLGWQFRVTDDPAPAAHALPGGTVLISRGALAYLSSEAELAAVLAHELAHAAHGHTDLQRHALPAHGSAARERASALDADEERQADALAVRYVGRAGYDPHAVGSALDALHRAVVVACNRDLARDDCSEAHDADDPHPPRAARLARVARAAAGGRGETLRARYLRAIDGLPLGGRDAVLESGRFQSPGGLSFALPSGFSPSLSGHVLTAKALASELTIARLHGRLFREALKASIRSAPFVSRRVAGHPTLIGTLGRDDEHVLAVLDDAPFVFIVAASGVGRDEHLERVLASARPADERRGLRLRQVTAPEPMRFGALVARRCEGTDPMLVRALNGIAWERELPRGFAVKCTTRE